MDFLKTQIHDNWVCSTETNCLSPIPDIILLHYIIECGLSGSNGQVHNLKIWTVTSDLPWTPSRVRFACWTQSIPIQQDGTWKGIGGVIIEMLVSMSQT